jgi:DNA-binding response OmpR family regulator
MPESSLRRIVLLVDANEDTCDLYGDWFFSRGFYVVTTLSNEMALAIAEAYRPDLLVTDLRGNGRDGFSLIRRLRSATNSRDIPIVVLTSVMDERLLTTVRAAGAEVLPKLGDFESLERRIAGLPPLPRSADCDRRRQPLGLSRILRRSPSLRES